MKYSSIFSTDHKIIAKQYLFLGLFFLGAAGFMALLIRLNLARPGGAMPIFGSWFFPKTEGHMPAETYNMLFTLHGSLMVFYAITPIVIGAFGNFAIPLQIGARDMAFPVLNMASFWTIFAGALVILLSVLLPGGSGAGGWTFYAPLNSNPAMLTNPGQTLWLVGIALAGTSSLMGGINYIATVLNCRCPGMTLMRLPLATWGLFYTSILNVLWVPLVAAAIFLMVFDRTLGTSFFTAGALAPRAGGQPLLFQHLFWGFGHPEVYILILPVWGLVGDLLSVFSRKPAFGYRVTVLSMASIVALSSVVWGHHMFTSGMSPLLGQAFVFLTITISVPTALFFLNWLGTLWRGALRFATPMLFAMGVIFVFGIGGLTGLFNALQSLDIYVHDTYFVVGHFHYTMAASVLFGGFAGIYFWFPKMFGKTMSRSLGAAHFWLTFAFLNMVFFSMMVVGLEGHMRRIADPSGYSFLKATLPWNRFMGVAASLLVLSQLVFLWNFIRSLFWGEEAPANPWDAASLEWTAPHPLRHGNFPSAPQVVRGPHEFGAPGAGARGWLSQDGAAR